jgi:hypothetical protein
LTAILSINLVNLSPMNPTQRRRGTSSWRAAKVGAILLGALSVLTLVVFWSGAPGVFGACAAWSAGLTRGGRPLGGAARIAGIVGVFVALLNIVVTVGGVIASAVGGG